MRNNIYIFDIVAVVVLLIIFINYFDGNDNRVGSSVTVPAGPIDYQAQKEDRLREKMLCESDGGFFHGTWQGCEYNGYTVLDGEIIEHD